VLNLRPAHAQAACVSLEMDHFHALMCKLICLAASVLIACAPQEFLPSRPL
jgi:hypothetical protein